MNDFMADERAAHWHALAREDGTRSGASFPLAERWQAGGRRAAVSFPRSGAFTDDLVELLARLAENVSFALDNFDRAEEKARAEEQKERLTRMFAALSETNEAIMRAKTRAEMFELVCAAAVLGGKFTSTTIALAKPGDEFCGLPLQRAKTTERVRSTRFATSAGHPEGRGLTGTAFRTKAALHHERFSDQ